jgi:hypothetical protein
LIINIVLVLVDDQGNLNVITAPSAIEKAHLLGLFKHRQQHHKG